MTPNEKDLRHALEFMLLAFTVGTPAEQKQAISEATDILERTQP